MIDVNEDNKCLGLGVGIGIFALRYKKNVTKQERKKTFVTFPLRVQQEN